MQWIQCIEFIVPDKEAAIVLFSTRHTMCFGGFI